MTDDAPELEAVVANRIAESIMPLLAGHPPAVQGAVIADLLAMLLAGHFAATPEDTAALREEILEKVLELVRHLIPVNEAFILARGNG